MACSSLIYPPNLGEGLVPSYSPGKRKAAAWLLVEKPREPFVLAPFCSVTVPTREGPGTVCGSSWGSGEVLDRVADLHTGPIEGPP